MPACKIFESHPKDVALQDFKDVGKQYVQDMRAKVPPSCSNATHVVDKMLRNSWNIGYISMVLPQACVIQVPTFCGPGRVLCHGSYFCTL